jgi:4-diphosphocytidyl-2-C-methyl-D-erythritol kinase
MSRAQAFAKLNLALVVGPVRLDGKHEVATVLQAIDLHDDVELEPADELVVEGFVDDTLVRGALEALAAAARTEPRWRVRIEKRIPVAAGLGGGSSDAAATLGLANDLLDEPLSPEQLHEIAARLGADVPFFLERGPQLATGDGSELAPLDLPAGYDVLLVLPDAESKESTASVYRGFDERSGADGFVERRAALVDALLRVESAADLAKLPRNDLASSPLADELARLGAFCADVSGAGPAVYGLFEERRHAESAAAVLGDAGRTWLVRPIAQR